MAVTNLLSNQTAGVTQWTGEGAPEGFVTAQVGELYTDRTAGTLWLKTSGAETPTGWTVALVGAKTVTVPLTVLVTGTLTAAANKARLQAPATYTIAGARISAVTAPTGAAVIVDVHKNGTTIFTTQANRPTIADGANDSGTTVPDITDLVAGDVLTVDVDQVGSGAAGANLILTLALQATTAA